MESDEAMNKERPAAAGSVGEPSNEARSAAGDGVPTDEQPESTTAHGDGADAPGDTASEREHAEWDRRVRDRLTRQGEEAIGKLAQGVLEHPVVTGAVSAAFDARARALRAQEAAMAALNLPSASDLERLTRRLRSVSQRMEAVEDGLDRLEEGVHQAGDGSMERRLERIEASLARIEAAMGIVAGGSAPVAGGSAPAAARGARKGSDPAASASGSGESPAEGEPGWRSPWQR
jgi:hypothetical protein